VIQERSAGSDSCNEQQRKASTPMSEGESHHMAVELADWKARLRKQRQELYAFSYACCHLHVALCEQSKPMVFNLVYAYPRGVHEDILRGM
jgi:hypothetical protein